MRAFVSNREKTVDVLAWLRMRVRVRGVTNLQCLTAQGGIFGMQKTTAKMIKPENVKQSFKVGCS